MSAIVVENLSKCYQIGHEVRHDTLRDAVAHRLRALVSRKNTPRADREDFWALRDVSFTIEPGEVVGVIGRNGAGKSTLLKVLSRITEPTKGRVSIHGRVASLLEVGTGFHPELSGRENIFLNGAILGMSRAEIRRKFDEIVAFAEVERFLDTPVKRYSSGMYVRLAFAVAAHLEPEILIVDEVLAVGDAQFQKKCLGKMREIASGSGRTVLFVSHAMPAVQNLCGKCIWLRDGSVQQIGDSPAVIAAYLAHGAQDIGGKAGQVLHSDRDFQIERFEANGEIEPTLIAGQPCRFVLHYRCDDPARFRDGVGMTLTVRLDGEKIVNLWNAYTPAHSFVPARRGVIECVLPAWPFRENNLTVDVYAHAINGPTILWVLGSMNVRSQDGDFYGVGRLSPPGEGILFLPHNWSHAPRE